MKGVGTIGRMQIIGLIKDAEREERMGWVQRGPETSSGFQQAFAKPHFND